MTAKTAKSAPTKPAPIKANSQLARILNALGTQKKWVSASEVHRRAGAGIRLSSRVSDLRKKGYDIEHREVKGKARATLAHQYRLMNPPTTLPGVEKAVKRITLDREAVPRDSAHRYRIYVVDEQNDLLLLGFAPSEETLGVEICRLARAGQLVGASLGIQDTYGIDNEILTGDWLLNPWDPKTV